LISARGSEIAPLVPAVCSDIGRCMKGKQKCNRCQSQHYAAHSKTASQSQTIMLLADKGADLTFRHDGCTIIHCLINAGCVDALEHLLTMDAARALINSRATDPSVPDIGPTPLYYVLTMKDKYLSKSEKAEFVRLLVSYGADSNIRCCGTTSLEYCSQHKLNDFIEIISNPTKPTPKQKPVVTTTSNPASNTTPSSTSPVSCDACKKQATTMPQCGRCKSVHYCSRECQRAAWASHKWACNAQSRAKK